MTAAMRLMRGSIIESRSFAAIAALDALAVNTSTYALSAASNSSSSYTVTVTAVTVTAV